jgi:Fe-S-cluster containining protein
MAAASRSFTDTLSSIYAETDALFADWSCAASGHCCQFSHTGRQPELWPIEWRALERALRARPGRKVDRVDGDCPAFDRSTRRCRAYAARPFGCRTHFCNDVCATGKNPRREIRELARRLAALAAVDEPQGMLRPLLSWYGRSGR